jgi:CheY-like chemotaxis protein
MSGSEHHRPTILLAEDEGLLRMAAMELLEDAGYDVLEAVDGDRGYEILESTARIDLLISDVKMPGRNGYQLAEAGLAMRPNLRVLLMTGYAQEPLPPPMRSAGVEVLYKPFDFDALVEVAGRLLRPAG